MSGLKEHAEQFTGEEIRLALLSPKITPVLIWELTTRTDLFDHFGGLLSHEFGDRLIDDMRQQREADSMIQEGGEV